MILFACFSFLFLLSQCQLILIQQGRNGVGARLGILMKSGEALKIVARWIRLYLTRRDVDQG
jgi:hypothetical protein